MNAAKVNNVDWDPNVPLRDILFDTIQEWTLKNTGNHPFHIHVYHMQVISAGGCGSHEEGEYYDTISSNSDCKVRFGVRDYGGMVVAHCHFLRHEDSGAM